LIFYLVFLFYIESGKIDFIFLIKDFKNNGKIIQKQKIQVEKTFRINKLFEIIQGNYDTV